MKNSSATAAFNAVSTFADMLERCYPRKLTIEMSPEQFHARDNTLFYTLNQRDRQLSVAFEGAGNPERPIVWMRMEFKKTWYEKLISAGDFLPGDRHEFVVLSGDQAAEELLDQLAAAAAFMLEDDAEMFRDEIAGIIEEQQVLEIA
jgi:hypothetical protein